MLNTEISITKNVKMSLFSIILLAIDIPLIISVIVFYNSIYIRKQGDKTFVYNVEGKISNPIAEDYVELDGKTYYIDANYHMSELQK